MFSTVQLIKGSGRIQIITHSKYLHISIVQWGTAIAKKRSNTPSEKSNNLNGKTHTSTGKSNSHIGKSNSHTGKSNIHIVKSISVNGKDWIFVHVRVDKHKKCRSDMPIYY